MFLVNQQNLFCIASADVKHNVSYISVSQLIRDFSPSYLKVHGCFDIGALVSQICFTSSVWEKWWIWFWQRFPLASRNLSRVTKIFFIVHLITAGEVEHTALLMLASDCRKCEEHGYRPCLNISHKLKLHGAWSSIQGHRPPPYYSVAGWGGGARCK